jgi:hypothetical protein
MLTLIIRGLKFESIKSDNLKGKSVIYHDKKIATIEHDLEEIVFQIHPQLEMTEFEFLRELILNITANHDVVIDETQCQLGYLENGEKAYLLKSWEPWKEFLMKAKLKTLEGQNVILKNEDEEELGNGLLAEYTTQSDPFRITSVTIITIFGERKFEDDSIVIEPTNQFG